MIKSEKTLNKSEFVINEIGTTAKVYKNALDNGETCFVRLERHKCTMENVYAEIMAMSDRFTEADLRAFDVLFNKAYAILLGRGCATDFFDLGTTYPSVVGSINNDGTITKADIKGFTLKLTPSKKALNLVANIPIENLIIAKTEATITSLTNDFTDTQDNTASPNQRMELAGTKLKISGEEVGGGIYLVPNGLNIDYSTIDSTWVQINKIRKNTAQKLEFYIPESISAGDYKLVVKTETSPGSGKLKSIVYANVVKIV